MGTATSSTAVPPRSSAIRPTLVIMVGAPGSGKSYLGAILADALGAEIIQTDAVRKELFPTPAYTPAENAAVYGTCHQRIRQGLAEGRRVVFDATNLGERRRRTLYALADKADANLVIVSAYAPESVIRGRLQQRMTARTPGDVSDADWPIYLRMRGDAQPIGRPHIIANTTAGFGPVLRMARRLVDA